MALQRLLVFEYGLQKLIAYGNFGPAAMTLGCCQAKSKIGAALWAIVPMVLLHIPILLRLAHLLNFLHLLPIFITQRRLGPETCYLG